MLAEPRRTKEAVKLPLATTGHTAVGSRGSRLALSPQRQQCFAAAFQMFYLGLETGAVKASEHRGVGVDFGKSCEPQARGVGALGKLWHRICLEQVRIHVL